MWDTPLTGDLPTALLYHLPEWCCYIPVAPPRPLWPDMPALQGFFVHLEWDANTHHTELRFVLDTESLEGPWLLPVALHVDGPGGLVGALQRSFAVGGENLATLGDVEHATLVWQQSAAAAAQVAPTLAPLVSLTLYLCSQAADLQDAQGQARRPTRPQPTKTKQGPRLFPPSQPTTWDVAYRLGAALRRAQQAAQERLDAPEAPETDARPRQAPRAHIRRAHWHLYWVRRESGMEKCGNTLGWYLRSLWG